MASKYENKFKAGDKFGMWSVVDGIIHGSPASIDVICCCNTKKRVDVYTLVKGKSTSCGCNRLLTKEQSSRWSGITVTTANVGQSGTMLIGSLSGTAMGRALNKINSSEGSHVTSADLSTSFSAQNGMCAITNKLLDSDSATISRINNSLPYEPNNILWVDKTISPVVRSLGLAGAATYISNASVASNKNIFENLGMKKEK